MSHRSDFLTTLTSAGFTPTKAILFEENAGTPKEFYSSTAIGVVGTPTWSSPSGYTAGFADAITDQYFLASSNTFLGTTAQTVLILRRNNDTVAREAQLFGSVSGSAANRCDATVPWSDGTVNFYVGTNTLQWTGYVRSTAMEAWGFVFGAGGMSIWLNGVKKQSNATAVTRVASAHNWKINGGGIFDQGFIQDHLAVILIPAAVNDSTMALFTPTNVLDGLPTDVFVTATKALAATVLSGPANFVTSTKATRVAVLSGLADYFVTSTKVLVVAVLGAPLIPLTGHFTAADKPFDGNTSATVLTRTLVGAVNPGDEVTLTGGTAAFANIGPGDGIPVTLTGAGLGGAHAGNYELVTVEDTVADITGCCDIRQQPEPCSAQPQKAEC